MKTLRLRLRSLRIEDAAQISALMTCGVSRWLTNFPLPFSLEDASHRIERLLQAEQEQRARVFVFEQKDISGLMGWFATYTSSREQRGVLGYWLGERFHSHGYMREGAPAALAAAAADLRLRSVEAYIHPENVGSRALIRRLGLTEDGEMPVHCSARGRDEVCLRYVKLLTG